MNALSVSELSNYIKALFDCDENLASVCVRGELSNYKIHTTGHHYFSLKDENAVIDAVLFRGNASRLRFTPKSGMNVILFGSVSSFPKSGRYQIYVTDILPDGTGALFAAFEELKNKLFNEGLFDESLKKELPSFPQRIGLVTSPTGAAVRDMIRILSNRFPLCKVIVCPVTVQGAGAAEDIAAMLDYLDKYDICDLIICGRGGGSAEDLWAFNEEILARAVARCHIPVISAVGHEPDVTIADFVSDKRASTPSAAAEIAVPDKSDVKTYLSSLFTGLINAEKLIIGEKREILFSLKSEKALLSPEKYLNDRRMHIALYEQKLFGALSNILSSKRASFIRFASALDAISPLKLLSRGYSVVMNGDKIVRSIKNVSSGDKLSILVSDGTLNCIVKETEEKNCAVKK